MATIDIIGRVDSNGTVQSGGTGFTATKKDEGKYEVDYSTAFSAIPTVVITAVASDGSSPRIATLYNVGVGGFQLSTINAAGSYKNAGFDFAVMS